MNDFNDLSKVIGMVISVFPILLPVFKFLQNRVLSLVNRHLKEKAIIEKIALELDSPSSLTPAVNPVDLNLGDFSYAA